MPEPVGHLSGVPERAAGGTTASVVRVGLSECVAAKPHAGGCERRVSKETGEQLVLSRGEHVGEAAMERCAVIACASPRALGSVQCVCDAVGGRAGRCQHRRRWGRRGRWRCQPRNDFCARRGLAVLIDCSLLRIPTRPKHQQKPHKQTHTTPRPTHRTKTISQTPLQYHLGPKGPLALIHARCARNRVYT